MSDQGTLIKLPRDKVKNGHYIGRIPTHVYLKTKGWQESEILKETIQDVDRDIGISSGWAVDSREIRLKMELYNEYDPGKTITMVKQALESLLPFIY